jgi:hypothetical protein
MEEDNKQSNNSTNLGRRRSCGDTSSSFRFLAITTVQIGHTKEYSHLEGAETEY